MIIASAPVRISFIGGGTDFSEWFVPNGGMCISAAINRYSYIMANPVSPFRQYKYRLCYSQIQETASIESVEHPLIKAVLKEFGVENIELFHCSDLPTSSGLGSSSTFLAALIEAIAKYKGVSLSREEILQLIWRIEHAAAENAGGYQDAIPAVYGGLNTIYFKKGGAIDVVPIEIGLAPLKSLQEHLMLFHTNVYRNSTDVAKTYQFNESKQWALLRMAESALNTFYTSDWERLGSLIDQSWRLKVRLSPIVTNAAISKAYATARTCGAFGGKLMGSGNGGCLMLVVPPAKQGSVRDELTKLGLTPIDFNFDFGGLKTLFNKGTYELHI
jgi:D-glycero-alpha-D-manno-heptose-7-phosphate kinase